VLLVFATSDKGGTGRSVTSSNVMYRRALLGDDVCYLDFDFGSPTAGAIFGIDFCARGLPKQDGVGGLHDYLQSRTSEAASIDVWSKSERQEMRDKPLDAGRLVLLPGDESGGEFPSSREVVQRCVRLFVRLQEEFDVCLVDLSAGRSQAIEIVLAATADKQIRNSSIVTRLLVFHRWTRQHILAAQGLVEGARGLLETGAALKHPPRELRSSVRFVRTAVVSSELQRQGNRAAQIAWLKECDRQLKELAGRLKLGPNVVLGQTPLDPMLQWREQLITDDDVWGRHVANSETAKAFQDLALDLDNPTRWEGL
jgi:hypothetical protein